MKGTVEIAKKGRIANYMILENRLVSDMSLLHDVSTSVKNAAIFHLPFH